jgi:hypothetical protein
MAIMNTPKTAIRLTVNKEVEKALRIAKRKYPTLSDPEILKLGLSKIVYEENERMNHEKRDILLTAANSVGIDYLSDKEEDIYSEDLGTKVQI